MQRVNQIVRKSERTVSDPQITQIPQIRPEGKPCESTRSNGITQTMFCLCSRDEISFCVICVICGYAIGALRSQKSQRELNRVRAGVCSLSYCLLPSYCPLPTDHCPLFSGSRRKHTL